MKNMQKEKFIKLIPVHIYAFAPIYIDVLFEIAPSAKNSYYHIRLLLQYFYFSKDLKSMNMLIYHEHDNIGKEDFYNFYLYKKGEVIKRAKIIRTNLRSFHESLNEIKDKNSPYVYVTKFSKLLDLVSYYRSDKLPSFLYAMNM